MTIIIEDKQFELDNLNLEGTAEEAIPDISEIMEDINTDEILDEPEKSEELNLDDISVELSEESDELNIDDISAEPSVEEVSAELNIDDISVESSPEEMSAELSIDDSLTEQMGATIVGASETIFYTMAIYYGSLKIKNI